MKVSIHQPNFFPWIGFFSKIFASDIFVVFDHVQPPQGRSWINRNKIFYQGGEYWLTLPIKRKKFQSIELKDVQIDWTQKQNHLDIVNQAYKYSNFKKEVIGMLEEIYSEKVDHLCEFNLNAIKTILGKMNVSRKFIRSSDLGIDNSLSGNELVLDINRKVGTSLYISGDGCLDFIRPETFRKENIEFEFIEVFQTNYKQNSNYYRPYLSIIDLLMSKGFEESKLVLEGNYNLWK